MKDQSRLLPSETACYVCGAWPDDPSRCRQPGHSGCASLRNVRPLVGTDLPTREVARAFRMNPGAASRMLRAEAGEFVPHYHRVDASVFPEPLDGTGVHFNDARKGQCKRPLWSDDETTGNVCGRKAPRGETYCPECKSHLYIHQPPSQADGWVRWVSKIVNLKEAV